MDEDLAYDPLFQRHTGRVLRELEKFRPDVIHITGLNDVSIVGAYLAWKLQIPMVGSWHTNLHQFAAERLEKVLRFLPKSVASSISNLAERKILAGAILYYKMPKVILSPNQELVDIFSKSTGRVSRIMSRGVDTKVFSPEKRTVNDGIIRFGFVGRLRPEKNVAMLVDLEKALIETGKSNFKFLIVGDGSEREYLGRNLRTADFTGFIDDDELSAAYANMDVFVFPSETDTFGNVIQEANASGVPAIVSDKGGPKFMIQPGKNGFVARSFDDFTKFSLELLDDPEKLTAMKRDARMSAMTRSWDAVFESVYDAYAECVTLDREKNASKRLTKDLAVEPSRQITDVFQNLVRHPVKMLIWRWNWKAALLSAMLRSPIFFTAYLAQKQGLWIALGAMSVQFVFRTLFGGVNGAALQAFSKVTPAWHAVVAIPIVLAAVSHIFEFGIQTAYDATTGSQGRGRAVAISVGISVISALFNLFAMRRGVLLVKDETGQSLWRDLCQMPSLALNFIALPVVWTWRKLKNV